MTSTNGTKELIGYQSILYPVPFFFFLIHLLEFLQACKSHKKHHSSPAHTAAGVQFLLFDKMLPSKQTQNRVICCLPRPHPISLGFTLELVLSEKHRANGSKVLHVSLSRQEDRSSYCIRMEGKDLQLCHHCSTEKAKLLQLRPHPASL